ncbi:topoisomerase-related nucleotidyltransferase [Babesia ovis]|uniref:Topoisomerase-related nucleotidyltransferase n=1 Tax=Babesia ovis TaxID=5869 RepID=A0A9W5WTV5_BABOV|nr:topoisomerase-related nucleotidyltransferase [Babesia ovis]
MESSEPPQSAGERAGQDDQGIVANLSTADLERLSAYCGPEVYSMVEDEKQREIKERNNAMREAIKDPAKSKREGRSKIGPTAEFITIKSKTDKEDTPAKPENVQNGKPLREILGLDVFYNTAKHIRVGFRVMLDVELSKLLEWLAPSEEERAAKEMVLVQLEMVVAALFPKAQMCVFGSYVTGLSLPGGDIDVCIKANGDEIAMLRLLVYALSRLELLHSFECVFNTGVPVVKAIDKNTGVKLDISIWQANAINTTNFVKAKCKEYKYMQPLVLLLKLFLQLRNLNDTYIGGIGSYLLYCMVLSFLQMHDATCRKSSDDDNTLANMFIDFFYYWGFIRDYDQFVTTVRGFGHVYPRTLFKTNTDSAMLACESPLEPSVDIGRHAFNMGSACSAFQQAFFALRDKETVMDARHRGDFRFERSSGSILENLYDPSHPVFQHRAQSSAAIPTSRRYQYQKFPNFENSLREVCRQLGEVTDRNEEGVVFNPQKKLMGSISQKEDSTSNDGKTDNVPFYVIAEAITNEFYSNE